MTMELPRAAKTVLETLQGAGFEAYAAGGCVRDFLLGRPCHDVDVATSALPREGAALFSRVLFTGEKHGTITVLLDGEPVEVTTFRKEGDYEGHRRPGTVQFCAAVTDDLSRRDFTVNAMAYNEKVGLVDPFGGREDLEKRLLRCVGKPEKRFDEDALRMLRAFRLCAELGFTMEAKTRAAIGVCYRYAASLSAERVYGELSRIFASPRPEFAGELVGEGLLDPFLDRSGRGLFPGGITDLCGLCYVLWWEGFLPQPDELPRRLKAPKRERKFVAAACAAAGADFDGSRAALKGLMERFGPTETRRGMLLRGRADWARTVDEIIVNGECYRLEQLALSGGDLKERGFSGPVITRERRRLLALCREDPSFNNREELLGLLKK